MTARGIVSHLIPVGSDAKRTLIETHAPEFVDWARVCRLGQRSPGLALQRLHVGGETFLRRCNALWGIYQMIGKLEPRKYKLRPNPAV